MGQSISSGSSGAAWGCSCSYCGRIRSECERTVRSELTTRDLEGALVPNVHRDVLGRITLATGRIQAPLPALGYWERIFGSSAAPDIQKVMSPPSGYHCGHIIPRCLGGSAKAIDNFFVQNARLNSMIAASNTAIWSVVSGGKSYMVFVYEFEYTGESTIPTRVLCHHFFYNIRTKAQEGDSFYILRNPTPAQLNSVPASSLESSTIVVMKPRNANDCKNKVLQLHTVEFGSGSSTDEVTTIGDDGEEEDGFEDDLDFSGQPIGVEDDFDSDFDLEPVSKGAVKKIKPSHSHGHRQQQQQSQVAKNAQNYTYYLLKTAFWLAKEAASQSGTPMETISRAACYKHLSFFIPLVIALDSLRLTRALSLDACGDSYVPKRTLKTGATIAGGWGGGWGGAAGGSAIGTMMAPGVGTVVGGMVGALAGGMGGALAAEAAVISMLEGDAELEEIAKDKD